MTLSQEEYEECRIAFNKFDQDGSGKIDVPELRATLQALGQHPTDEELFLMISSGAWRAHQGSRATASVPGHAQRRRRRLGEQGVGTTTDDAPPLRVARADAPVRAPAVDDDNSGEIEFPEFVKIIQQQKVSEQENEEEQDTLLAFVALGGNVS